MSLTFSIDLLQTHKASLLVYLNSYKGTMDSAHTYRLNTVLTLSETYLIYMHHTLLQQQQSQSDINNTQVNESSDHTPPVLPLLPLTSIYTILSELKALEWKYIQKLHIYNKNCKDNTGSNIPQMECFTKICKKRKASVVIDGITTSTNSSSSTSSSSVVQKQVDQLQQYHIGIESTDLVEGRILHCSHEKQGNWESLLGFDWSNYVDMSTQQSDIVTLLS